MRPDPGWDERLAGRVLHEADRLFVQGHTDRDHPDEETLALFTLGALKDQERAAVIRHLAECVDCRAIASLVLSLPVATASGRSPAKLIPRRGRGGSWAALAAAASVVLIITAALLVRRPWNDPAAMERETYARADAWLRAGKFAEARKAIASAARRGVVSDRLSGIESQAIRLSPGPLMLAFAGRLPDFGFDVGGVVARGPGSSSPDARVQAAYEVLARAGSTDVPVLLNRGHALLALGRPRDALADFRRAAALAPGDPLAWLGQGLADYALADYAAAEAAFRKCLRLDTHQAAARFNLAMTLEERGKLEEARDVWRDVLSGTLPESTRDQVRREIEELERQTGGRQPRAAPGLRDWIPGHGD